MDIIKCASNYILFSDFVSTDFILIMFFRGGMDFYCITLIFFYSGIHKTETFSHIYIYIKEFHCTAVSLFWCLLK